MDARTWFVFVGGQQQGPIGEAALREMAADGRLHPDDLVWCSEMPHWAAARTVSGLFLGPPLLEPSVDSSKRIVAGVLAILLGSLGVHKFVLGQTAAGLILLLVTLLSCFIAAPVTSTIGLIEGIIYLTKSDAEFRRTYEIEGRAWF